jgi:large subunit ribosomal protein L24
MKIKKGDIVKIIKGKDRGKTGKALQVRPSEQKITVEGLNLAVKHLRPRRSGEKGQRVQFPVPIPVSNVMLICPKCTRSMRVSRTFMEGKKMRQCKKCKEIFS